MMKLINFWYEKMEGPWAHYLAHFMGGFMLSTIFGHLNTLIIGLIVASVCGALKELGDYLTKKGQVSFVAWLITSLGGLLAYGVLGIK